MTRALVTVALSAALAGCALAGCAPLGSVGSTSAPAPGSSPSGSAPSPAPGVAPGTPQVSAAVRRAETRHEYPAPAVRPPARTGFATPELAIETFAVGYVNWNGATVARQMRALAAISVGQARSAVTLIAAETVRDYELRRAGVANRGSVQALAPLLGGAGRYAAGGTPDRYAVVTLERTTASATTAYQGLRPAWHVALATVVRASGGGWVVSTWQPEN